MSIRISQGFFSACETRRIIGRPIPKSIPAIASPIIGLDGSGNSQDGALQYPPKDMAARHPDR